MSRAGVEITKVVKRGHLRKLGGSIKNWKERLVVLGERRIAYYDDSDPNDLILKGEFYIQKESKVEEFEDEKEGSGFQIYIDKEDDEKSKEEERVYKFVMCSEENQAEWIEAVQGVIDKIVALPKSHYFIPELEATNAKVFGRNLPKGIPTFLVKILPSSTYENESINNEIYRPEELIEWVDEGSMDGLFDPVKHVKVPEYKVRTEKTPWGKGVTHFLKFDLALSQFIKKATKNIRARMDSPDGKIPEDAIFTSDEMNALNNDISVEFARARTVFLNNKKDDKSAEMGLDYLWTDTQQNSELHNKWYDWVRRYISFIAIIDQYTLDGVDYTMYMISNMYTAVDNYARLKEENYRISQENLSDNSILKVEKKVYDILYPEVKEWPRQIANSNIAFRVDYPQVAAQCISNSSHFASIRSFRNSENLEEHNKAVFDYCDFVFNKEQELVERLKTEAIDWCIKIVAPRFTKGQIGTFVANFRPQLTEEEKTYLSEKMQELAK
jgi:hypothetical protein